MTANEVDTISLAAHESQCERIARIIRWALIGWTLSVITLGMAIIYLSSYEEVTSTTTSEVAQDSGDYGSNIYAGGDMTYGYADSENDDNDDRP